MEEKEIVKERKKSRVRSPGYPMIDLKEAIEKIKVLWDKDKTNSIPRDVAAKHLGYGSAEGYPGRVIAALKHFDLISMREGDIILNEKAVDLVLHSPSDKIYVDIVREIALKPTLYEELFNEYKGSLPSEATLKAKLIKDYKFNAEKVDRFINNFRSSLDFAGLLEGEEVETKSGEVMIKEIAKTRIGTGMDAVLIKPKSFDIPLMDGSKATITFDKYPLEEEDIDFLKKWFEIYAPALKKKKSKEEPTKPEDI